MSYGALDVSQGESLETPQYSFHFHTTSIQQMGNSNKRLRVIYRGITL